MHFIFIDSYDKKFDKENLQKNNIVSCVVVNEEKNKNNEKIKRHIIFDLLKLRFITIPETILYYLSDTKITIEHNIEIDRKERIISIEVKNITHPTIKFNEKSSFCENENIIMYKLTATLSVNIFIGINETIRKLWYLQYKMYYKDYDDKLKNN